MGTRVYGVQKTSGEVRRSGSCTDRVLKWKACQSCRTALDEAERVTNLASEAEILSYGPTRCLPHYGLETICPHHLTLEF